VKRIAPEYWYNSILVGDMFNMSIWHEFNHMQNIKAGTS